jgi:acylphosphatase
MDMTRKRLQVKGQKVHDVGYRPFLLGLAESLEIERFFADNIFIEGKQAVYALIDSSGENVRAFIEIASSKFPENSDVEKVEEEDYTGNVMKTESYYRYLTAMQLSRIATYGGNMLEKQDKMLEKQDSLLGITQKGFDEMKTGFDEMKTGFREVKEEVGKGSAEVKNEIHLLRDDFRELFMREVNELRSEILVLKETVARIEKAIASG